MAIRNIGTNNVKKPKQFLVSDGSRTLLLIPAEEGGFTVRSLFDPAHYRSRDNGRSVCQRDGCRGNARGEPKKAVASAPSTSHIGTVAMKRKALEKRLKANG